MIVKVGLVLAYAGAMFNMLVINSFRYPQNIPHILDSPETWLYPEIQRAWNLLTEQEIPYQEEKDLLESNKD